MSAKEGFNNEAIRGRLPPINGKCLDLQPPLCKG